MISQLVDYHTPELAFFERENHAFRMYVKRLPFHTKIANDDVNDVDISYVQTEMGGPALSSLS